MTDRELLEAAAKAAGYEIEETRVGGLDRLFLSGDLNPWNPLADDGDALRLAVKRRLNISFTRGLGPGHKEEYMQVVPSNLGHLAEFGAIGEDANATIRRAIVCAAAAMESA